MEPNNLTFKCTCFIVGISTFNKLLLNIIVDYFLLNMASCSSSCQGINQLNFVFDVSHLIAFNFPEEEKDIHNFFTRGTTLTLIDLYKKYKNKVGTFEIKNLKKMWEVIAKDISNIYKITISANKCENRFKVLERNLKKTIENNNKSGRGRKIFEFQREMEELFEKKRNVYPVTLLSTNTIVPPEKLSEAVINEPVCDMIAEINNCDEVTLEVTDENSAVEPLVSAVTPKKKMRTTSAAYKKRNDILNEIKNDLKLYYERKLEFEKEKLEIAKRTLQDREDRTKMLKQNYFCNDS